MIPESTITAVAIVRLAPLARYCWNANAAEIAEPAGRLIASAERLSVTAIAYGSDIRTLKARSSRRCCRANMPSEASSATAAISSHRASTLAAAAERSARLGTLSRSTNAAATAAAQYSAHRSHLRTGRVPTAASLTWPACARVRASSKIG
jgi:hypothetical protein